MTFSCHTIFQIKNRDELTYKQRNKQKRNHDHNRRVLKQCPYIQIHSDHHKKIGIKIRSQMSPAAERVLYLAKEGTQAHQLKTP